MDGDFLFDDETSIVQNPAAQTVAGFLAATERGTVFSGRPVTDFTFALDAERSQLRPRAFHETGLALHFGTVHQQRAYLNIGHELQQRGDLEGALANYRRALEIGAGPVHAGVFQHMGSALIALQRPGEARAVLERQQPPEPETQVLLAFAALGLGDVAEAARLARELVWRAPGYYRSHLAMAQVRLAMGDLAGAREAYRRGVALFPLDASAFYDLGRVEARLGDVPAACASLGRAAALPNGGWVSQFAATDRARLSCR